MYRPRSSPSACSRPWPWSPGAGLHLAAARSGRALSPRPVPTPRPSAVRLLRPGRGGSIGARRSRRLPSSSSRDSIQIHGGSNGAAPKHAGPACGVRCRVPVLWASRPGSTGEAPSLPAHRGGGGVQEGALCHVAAPGSASRPLPASGSSAPPGPHGALPLCWRIAKITVLRFAAPRIAAPAHLPAWGARGCSTLHSPFLYLRHYWEGTHDSHLSPKIF